MPGEETEGHRAVDGPVRRDPRRGPVDDEREAGEHREADDEQQAGQGGPGERLARAGPGRAPAARRGRGRGSDAAEKRGGTAASAGGRHGGAGVEPAHAPGDPESGRAGAGQQWRCVTAARAGAASGASGRRHGGEASTRGSGIESPGLAPHPLARFPRGPGRLDRSPGARRGAMGAPSTPRPPSTCGPCRSPRGSSASRSSPRSPAASDDPRPGAAWRVSSSSRWPGSPSPRPPGGGRPSRDAHGARPGRGDAGAGGDRRDGPRSRRPRRVGIDRGVDRAISGCRSSGPYGLWIEGQGQASLDLGAVAGALGVRPSLLRPDHPRPRPRLPAVPRGPRAAGRGPPPAPRVDTAGRPFRGDPAPLPRPAPPRVALEAHRRASPSSWRRWPASSSSSPPGKGRDGCRSPRPVGAGEIARRRRGLRPPRRGHELAARPRPRPHGRPSTARTVASTPGSSPGPVTRSGTSRSASSRRRPSTRCPTPSPSPRTWSCRRRSPPPWSPSAGPSSATTSSSWRASSSPASAPTSWSAARPATGWPRSSAGRTSPPAPTGGRASPTSRRR